MEDHDQAAEPDSTKGTPGGPTVVGVGASAGGLAALRKFFENVPADSGLAYVVVVHLSPDHESHLADVLQSAARLPIVQVSKTTPIEANHAYVIPPNANLNSVDAHLRLSPMEEHRRDRAPIDHFFRTLAAIHDGRSVGVILTGTGSDGTLGVRDIKAKGGFVLVQDPNEAEFNGMPQSAISTGVVDQVLPVSEIPAAILRLERNAHNVQVPEDAEDTGAIERTALENIFAHLRARAGRDFSRYKRSTVLRRISRRMQLNSTENLDAYLEFLCDRPEEVRALADDLLITVTHFFRDPEVFAKLEKEIVPRLFHKKHPDQPVRVWSVGCATGEEAYSLAILLVEEAARREFRPSIQIFASDLHKPSLEQARDGLYPEGIETDVSEERLRRFFQKESGGYRIRKEIRDLIVFTPHNLLGDPPFSRLDLICCRNLLIYLQRDVQRDVGELFHYALNADGILVLGSSESLDSTDLFQVENKKLCIYRKRGIGPPEARRPAFPFTRTRITARVGERAETPPEPIAYASLHRQLVESNALPSLLLSPENRVIHLSERVGRFLTVPGGEPTNNVFKLLREEMRVELRSLLHKVRETRTEGNSGPIPVQFDGHPVPVVLRVRPAKDSSLDGFALVMFDELEISPVAEEAEHAHSGKPAARVAELETEVAVIRQRLQAVIEEYETSQEEMHASNEEMHSTNEELRSTLEELETSKEELQSINEEHQTVNQENRHKVEELALLSSDLTNLLAATGIATLFLDRELRILRFTPRLEELFNVRVTDRGRPISDLTHRLGYDELYRDAQAVLSTLIPVEREVQDANQRWYLTRLLPYRSTEDRIEGVVISFIDITTRKAAEEQLRESEERYRLLVENAREYAILMLSPKGAITTWNTGAQRLFGYTASEVIDQPAKILYTPEDCDAGLAEQELDKASEFGHVSEERWYRRKDGSRFWATGVLETWRNDAGEVRGFVRVLRDNTERKRVEDYIEASGRELQATNQALVRANDDLKHFAFAASHDLRAPLRSLSVHTALLKDAWDRNDRATAEAALSYVAEGAARMDALLMDLLSYTRLGTTEAGADQRADLGAALSAALANLEWIIKEQQAEVTFDPLPTVRGEHSRFIELFQNLVDNGLKYRSTEPPKIHVSARSEGETWIISVKDNGIGIDANHRKIVFDLFKRLHGDDRPGTGMGLAICKRIVNRYGGEIWVESDGKNGSTFYFSIPA